MDNNGRNAGEAFISMPKMILGQDKRRAIAHGGGKMSGGTVTTTMHFRASQILGAWEQDDCIVWVIDCLPAPLEQVRDEETVAALRRFVSGDDRPMDQVISVDPVGLKASPVPR